MNRYPLKVESLRKDCTTSDVRSFLDWPQTDVLENIELFSNGPTSTAILVLTRPDVVYEFLNLKEPEINGKRVTLMPELFEEMSITLNGSWLREIEDENPAIQVEIQKIADMFNLELTLQKSDHGNTNTICLAGVPWKLELARKSLTDKIQAIIMNRSANVQKILNETTLHPDAAGIQSSGNKTSGPSTKVDDKHTKDEQRKPALKSGDPQLFINSKSGVENEGSTELDDTNPGKRRVRMLKTDETRADASGSVSSISKSDVAKDQPKEVRKTRVLKSKPEEMHASESSLDTLGKSTPIHYPASTQYQTVITVEMDIHKYLLEHSTILDFDDCSISQIPVSEQHIDWIIGNSNEKDLRMNEEQLKRLIDKLRKECYSAPDEFDFEIFKDLIETNNKSKNVTLIFNPKERSCKIVGLPDEVKSTYKWISETAKLHCI